MIFEEQTVKMAKELAKEFVRLEKKKNRESIVSAFEEMKSKAVEIWDALKSTFMAVYEEISLSPIEVEKRKHNWYLPKKIPMTNQVLDRRPMVANIRNSI